MALPPGPRSSLWSLVRYFRDPMGVMPAMAKEYGETFTIPGNPPLVCTGDPEGIKAIYAANPDTLEPLSKDLAFVLGDQSLILIGGPEHRRKRKLMMPPFQGARMRAYGAAMQRITEQHTAQWEPGRTVGGHETAQRISLEVILEVVFGLREPAERAELGRQLTELLEGFSPLLGIFPWLRREFGGIGPYAAFRRRQRAVHERVDALIAAAREDEGRDDILSLLIGARDEDGAPMSDEDVRQQLLLLVVAGHETTAIAIAWGLYALHQPQNVDVLERLRAELRALGPTPQPELVAKLPYLDAVCRETLRRHPLAPAPAPRRLLAPMTLGGYELPAGVGVAAAIGVAHLRAQSHPDPLRFRPERFLERKPSPFEYLPYGGGARRCLGAAMADYELRVVLGTLVHRFGLRLASNEPDRGKVRAANVGPAHGVKLVVESRRPVPGGS
ncbi:cytochrome P450 [Paraliomyxa miuraensis]|uniref:cytochrome P450 n=1 Tax=Paraliomyxa miuraensis TaxID=376150 RepID=UPI002253156E|nr:cytochrome P450 [Paraliomyxa miuraensis]MCX4239942.1 cytochrome P450 [Paraliomyxa miuraensis]